MLFGELGYGPETERSLGNDDPVNGSAVGICCCCEWEVVGRERRDSDDGGIDDCC